MFQPLLDKVRGEFSGAAAKEYVAHIACYHRIQASPGYRQAAAYVADHLRRWGLDVAVHRYPARYDQHYWSAQMFQEWDCAAATLHLLQPASQARKLADFREQPISVIQRSIAADGEYAVVPLADGTRREHFAALDVRGKLVLTSASVDRVRALAVEEFGAAGVLFDGMNPVPPTRQVGDLPDVRQYTSWWWTGHETPCFGFVLTPRQGAWLRDLARQGEVSVRARVDARLYDGELEVIDASLPGETPEEVVVLSHLCHPAPGANDNGSGVAANMEVARTLATLVHAGALPRPRRTIRFLWMPEMTGTYAYLASHPDRIPNMVAGLNLDMVGADQEAVGSVSLIDRPPESAPSFAADLVERLRDEFTTESTSYSGVGAYALHRHATVPFSGGSDHYILSDPTVGVPCPMLIEWPDRFYHTSHDSLEKVSPTTLARNGGLAAAYAYWLATAGSAEAHWLGEEMVSRAKSRILSLLRAAVTDARRIPAPSAALLGAIDGSGPSAVAAPEFRISAVARRVAYRVEREQLALSTLQRIAGHIPLAEWHAELARFAFDEGQAVGRALGAPLFDAAAYNALRLASSGLVAPDVPDTGPLARIPRRRFPGPISLREHVARLTPAERERFHRVGSHRLLPVLAVYWADGERSIGEIGRRVAFETGQRDLPDFVELFELLASMGLVEMLAAVEPV